MRTTVINTLYAFNIKLYVVEDMIVVFEKYFKDVRLSI